jgi:hypothetical protein
MSVGGTVWDARNIIYNLFPIMRRAGAEYLCSHRDCSLRDAVLPLRLLVAVLPHRRPGQDPPCQQSCRGSGRIHVSQERLLLFKNKKIAVLWIRTVDPDPYPDPDSVGGFFR